MIEDEKQDALAWLFDRAGNGAAEARKVLELLGAYETRENTVLGMCLAQRPHTEIRDYLLAASSDA